MNKSEQLISLLKTKPLTRAEIDIAFGCRFSSSQIRRLIRFGTIEEFEDFNEDSSGRWARIKVNKLRVSGEYVNRSKSDGHITVKTAQKYIAALRANGYEVI